MTDNHEDYSYTEAADKLDTANIVASYVGRNEVPIDQLPELIKTVYDSISNLKRPVAEAVEVSEEAVTYTPAVPVDESVKPDYLVCLEDGKKLKMLKRHLQTAYNMTPDDYRKKWGLESDYPMTAPAYAEVRSGLAKKIGLGKKTVTTKKTVAKAAKKTPKKAVAAV
jgi:predicted transcriptional regulator